VASGPYDEGRLAAADAVGADIAGAAVILREWLTAGALAGRTD
jgi:hypothetical protein